MRACMSLAATVVLSGTFDADGVTHVSDTTTNTGSDCSVGVEVSCGEPS